MAKCVVKTVRTEIHRFNGPLGMNFIFISFLLQFEVSGNAFQRRIIRTFSFPVILTLKYIKPDMYKTNDLAIKLSVK